MNAICQQCGQEFNAKYGTQKYCSVACYWAHGRSARHCKHCGKQYESRSSTNTTFCCAQCKNEWLKKHPTQQKRKKIKCDSCGKTIHRVPAHINKHNFCDRSCYLQWHHGERITLFCSQCKEKIVRKISEQKGKPFCSKKCWDKWRSENQRGENHSQYQRVETSCAQCGKQILVAPNKLRTRKNNFCGNECRHLWNKDAFTGENNPAWKGGYSPYYGPDWYRQRDQARKRDNYCCQNCGISEENLSYELHVHHIKAFRLFGYVPGENKNYVEANKLNNLISLCASCHPKAEER